MAGTADKYRVGARLIACQPTRCFATNDLDIVGAEAFPVLAQEQQFPVRPFNRQHPRSRVHDPGFSWTIWASCQEEEYSVPSGKNILGETEGKAASK